MSAAWEQESVESLTARREAANAEANRALRHLIECSVAAETLEVQVQHAIETGGRMSIEDARLVVDRRVIERHARLAAEAASDGR